MKILCSMLIKSSNLVAFLKSNCLKWSFQERALLNFISSAWRRLPSGGCLFVGVGEKDGEREARSSISKGTDTPSTQIGLKFSGS